MNHVRLHSAVSPQPRPDGVPVQTTIATLAAAAAIIINPLILIQLFHHHQSPTLPCPVQ